MEPRLPALDEGSLSDRVDSLATWMNEIEARLHAAELASGDEKTARELRKALEALAKHDPKLEKRITDHVAVVADRLETLASTISQTAAALAARDGEIASLRRELEDAERKIESLGQPVHLELWVKVREGWSDDESALRKFGYDA